MTQAGLKEDNATNRAEWRKKLIRYIYRRPQMSGQARDEEDLLLYVIVNATERSFTSDSSV